MKPKDLKTPFTWESRRVMVDDGVWYVPERVEDYTTFTFPGWEALFGNGNPVYVEYCSGNGSWIANRALENPQVNWLAVEKKFKRVRKIWSKRNNHRLNNLFALCGEGNLATQHYFPASTVDRVFVNFPDPWPKDRHAKHRIIQPRFTEQVRRILKPEGVLTVVTDHEGYSEQIIETLLAQEGLESLLPNPYYVHEWDDYGTSYFEDLWRSHGLKIRYHQFRKKG